MKEEFTKRELEIVKVVIDALLNRANKDKLLATDFYLNLNDGSLQSRFKFLLLGQTRIIDMIKQTSDNLQNEIKRLSE